jgi:hypothetical protein
VKPRRLALAAAAAVVVAMAVPASASANATTTLALYNMNEARGSRVLADASGHRLNGTIGSEVILSGTAHTFGYLKPNTPPVHPGHLDSVASSQLNPGNRDYAINLRLKWTVPFGNIIQKGQTGAVGGWFKIQAPNGIVQCLFHGSKGQGGVGSGRRLNDGKWHVIRCLRTATQVVMAVDGVVTARKNGPTGTIANTWPLTIAGKARCDQVKVTCDYWAGSIDYVLIQAN